MTEKKKAKELFDKFYKKIPSDELGNDYQAAKECTLISVDEILDLLDCESWNHNSIIKSSIEYWNQVRQEVIKL